MTALSTAGLIVEELDIEHIVITCRSPLDIEWDQLHEERKRCRQLTDGARWSVYTTERDRRDHARHIARVKAIDIRLLEMVS